MHTFFNRQLCVFFTLIDSSHYSVHKSIKVRWSKTEYFTRYFVFYVKILEPLSLIARKVLNEIELNYTVLESSRVKLQECVIKSRQFHLKNWWQPSRDLQTTFQGQTNDIILCLSSNHATFVWNFFSKNTFLQRYSGG